MTRTLQRITKVHSSCSWAVLLLLAWSQVSFATHQFDHSVWDLHAPCAVCLQFERDDDVVIDQPVCIKSSPGQKPRPAASPFLLPAEHFGHYQSRASP